MTDPIADMLTRIRNALMVKKAEVVLPYSKIKNSIAEILKKESYINEVEVTKDGLHPGQNQIKVSLKYNNGNQPAITSIKRISTSGRRCYVAATEIPYVLDNYGIAIISTSQGLMTNIDARKKKLGGEVLCEIY